MSEHGAKDRAAFSRAFADALAASTQTLTRLHRRLGELGDPVSVATLSSWRSGARHPDGVASVAAVERIEQILGLDPGALAEHLVERSRLGGLGEAARPFDGTEMEALVADALDSLRAPSLGITRALSMHVTIDVGRDGDAVRHITRSLVQGIAPVAEEISYLFISPNGNLREPAIEVLGGRLDRVLLDESSRVLLCVIALDHPLTHGETEMIELRLEGPTRSPHDRESGALAVRPIRDLVVWTRFHPDGLPDWVEEFEWSPTTGDTGASRSIRPSASVHQVRRDFGPGALSLRWGFGEDAGDRRGA